MPGKVDASAIFLDQDWWVLGIRPKQLLNQKFATVLHDEDFSNYDCRVVNGFISRPRMPASMKASGLSEWKMADEGFQISFELDEFEAEDIAVKTIDRYVEVRGKHEEKQDQYGLVSREFCRRFRLPDNCDINAVATSFSLEKRKLTIMAPKVLEQSRVYNGPRELPLRERVFDPSRTEMEHEDFLEVQDLCQNMVDEHLDIDRIMDGVQAEHAKRDATPDMDEFKETWLLLKEKQTEQGKIEIDQETQEKREIVDTIIKEAIDMFGVPSESLKAPVDSPAAVSPPKTPVDSPAAVSASKAAVDPPSTAPLASKAAVGPPATTVSPKGPVDLKVIKI